MHIDDGVKFVRPDVAAENTNAASEFAEPEIAAGYPRTDCRRELLAQWLA